MKICMKILYVIWKNSITVLFIIYQRNMKFCTIFKILIVYCISTNYKYFFVCFFCNLLNISKELEKFV